jgi:hypothetical protein
MTKKGGGWRLAAAAGLLAGMWLLVWGVHLVGGAGEEKAAEGLPADLACISPAVEGFACLHVAELWDSKPLASVREKLAGQINKELKLQRGLGVAVEQIDRLTLVAPVFRDLEEPVLLVVTRRPYDRDRVLATVGDKAEKKAIGDRTVYAGGRRAVCLLDDRTFAFGPPRALQQCLEMATEKKDGPLSDAVRRAGEKHLLVQAANWGPLTAQLRQFESPQLEPFKALLAAKTSLLVVDFDDKVKADLQVSFDKEDEAREALKPVRNVLQTANKELGQVMPRLRQEKEMAPFLKQLEAVQTGLKNVSTEQKGKMLRIQGTLEVDPNVGPLAIQAVAKVREASLRTQSTNNLKQIGLAMYNYNDANQQLPAQAIFGKDGKPLLSWRVAILPYVDQEALYKEFHLDEPWDSEHNKKLIARMPLVYASPVDPEATAKHHTHYLGFVGPGAFFEGKKGLKLPAAFPDGTSNTIMIVEASRSVPWTKPEDIPFDPEKELPRIGGLYPFGFLATICDGSVRAVSKSVSKETLRNAINRQDGNPLGSDW